MRNKEFENQIEKVFQTRNFDDHLKCLLEQLSARQRLYSSGNHQPAEFASLTEQTINVLSQLPHLLHEMNLICERNEGLERGRLILDQMLLVPRERLARLLCSFEKQLEELERLMKRPNSSAKDFPVVFERVSLHTRAAAAARLGLLSEAGGVFLRKISESGFLDPALSEAPPASLAFPSSSMVADQRLTEQVWGYLQDLRREISAHQKIFEQMSSSVFLAAPSLSAAKKAQISQVLESLRLGKGKLSDQAWNETEGLLLELIEMTSLPELRSFIVDTVETLQSEYGKEICVIVTGQHFMLSEERVKDLKDILGRLLKNAVEHGLESREIRAKAGKANPALIQVQFFRTPLGLECVVRDDGQGFDIEEIRWAISELDLVSIEEAVEMRDEELLAFVFDSEFASIDPEHNSDRCIGLDQVREKIELLGGRIFLKSVLGAGTSFHFAFPLKTEGIRLDSKNERVA